MSEKEILIIEDDPSIARNLSPVCETELGLALRSVTTGQAGLEAALAEAHALVIVDVNIPGKSGFEICRALRAARPEQMILFLTGRSEEVDKIIGLELGADDYMTKPFSTRELVARMRGLIRRGEMIAESGRRSGEVPDIISIGKLKIETGSRRVWKNDQLLPLTAVEYDILELLASNPGRVFERNELISAILGYCSGTHDDVLTVHFSRLRAKVEDNPNSPVYVKTVRGIGYRFAAADELGEKG